MEASASSVLLRAVQYDKSRRYTEALICYQEGIQLLLDCLKVNKDENKKNQFRQKVTEYMDRAEKIKKIVQEEKEAGTYHEQIQILDNSVGHSYEEMFGRFLDENVTAVEVDDPYIKSHHQIYNFLRFCELLVKCCKKLKTIALLTKSDENAQKENFDKLARSLKNHNVALTISYSITLHDREIRLDNGWVIKIGRGLDIFKPTENKFCIGFCDLSLRPCYETTIDIFHRSSLKI